MELFWGVCVQLRKCKRTTSMSQSLKGQVLNVSFFQLYVQLCYNPFQRSFLVLHLNLCRPPEAKALSSRLQRSEVSDMKISRERMKTENAKAPKSSVIWSGIFLMAPCIREWNTGEKESRILKGKTKNTTNTRTLWCI